MSRADRTRATPRKAATVVLLREGAHGFQVLMLRRHRDSGFAADAWVFPGGTVEEADALLPRERWRGICPDALTTRFGESPDLVLGMHVAAVRETFEEAGILLAGRPGRPWEDVSDVEARTLRRRLATREAGAVDFARWLHHRSLVCELGALAYWSRWITPIDEPRRYDTCFFLAAAPAGQDVEHDRVETIDERWVRPAEALVEHQAGRLTLIYPTVRTLEQLAGHESVQRLLASARTRTVVPPILPHFERRADGAVRVLHPDDPEFPRHLYVEELGVS